MGELQLERCLGEVIPIDTMHYRLRGPFLFHIGYDTELVHGMEIKLINMRLWAIERHMVEQEVMRGYNTDD